MSFGSVMNSQTKTSMKRFSCIDGRPTKVMLWANRNGNFYVLDRTNGRFLLGKPFVEKLTWAKGLDAKGRPILNPNQEPTIEGARICPGPGGGTNWKWPLTMALNSFGATRSGTSVSAIHGGVSAAHILDGRIAHSLLLELFTDAGVGTKIEAAP